MLRGKNVRSVVCVLLATLGVLTSSTVADDVLVVNPGFELTNLPSGGLISGDRAPRPPFQLCPAGHSNAWGDGVSGYYPQKEWLTGESKISALERSITTTLRSPRLSMTFPEAL